MRALPPNLRLLVNLDDQDGGRCGNVTRSGELRGPDQCV
jgi:hypothetical protein